MSFLYPATTSVASLQSSPFWTRRKFSGLKAVSLFQMKMSDSPLYLKNKAAPLSVPRRTIFWQVGLPPTSTTAPLACPFCKNSHLMENSLEDERKMIFRGILVLAVALVYVNAQNSCDTIEWTGGQFAWPNDATKSLYKSTGRYIPKNVIATRVQVYRDEAFVALPRYKPGVPVTLARINLKQRGCEAILEPYPCWATQEEGDLNAFQNVVDIYLDENNILWVLDIGVVNTLENPIRRCAPKVIAINILTGKKVKSLDLCGLVAQASRLQYVVAEYAPDGRPFVYISDAATRSILVFDVAGNRGYRVVLPKVVANCRRDVLYIALIRKPQCCNYLVLTYLSGSRIFQIKTEHLRAGCAAGKIQDLGVKGGKAVVLGTDLGSALFFRFEGKPEIYRWEVGPCFKGYELVYRSPENYLATQTVADVARRRIRVLESNFPDYIKNTVGCGASQRIGIMISTINNS